MTINTIFFHPASSYSESNSRCGVFFFFWLISFTGGQFFGSVDQETNGKKSDGVTDYAVRKSVGILRLIKTVGHQHKPIRSFTSAATLQRHRQPRSYCVATRDS